MIAPVQTGVRQIALLGNPNTGKTTLFNALTGIYACDAGGFRFAGAPVDIALAAQPGFVEHQHFSEAALVNGVAERERHGAMDRERDGRRDERLGAIAPLFLLYLQHLDVNDLDG